MHASDNALLRALVVVAWADGRFADEERAMIEALLEALGATPDEREEMRAYASTPRTIDELDVGSLSASDRENLLQHAVAMSLADDVQDEKELAVLRALADRLGIAAPQS
jgi:uncharacterized membrane protein YebE (DUF533 family)